jgi:hypothetical protein
MSDFHQAIYTWAMYQYIVGVQALQCMNIIGSANFGVYQVKGYIQQSA